VDIGFLFIDFRQRQNYVIPAQAGIHNSFIINHLHRVVSPLGAPLLGIRGNEIGKSKIQKI
jgi:hypothetical protein